MDYHRGSGTEHMEAVSLVLSMGGSLGCGFYLQTPLGRPAALCLLVVDSHMVV